jgi:endonuclease YncB( thermonuclease family)
LHFKGKKDILKEKVQAAQRAKLGIWSLGDHLVTPAEFKRNKKAMQGQV